MVRATVGEEKIVQYLQKKKKLLAYRRTYELKEEGCLQKRKAALLKYVAGVRRSTIKLELLDV